MADIDIVPKHRSHVWLWVVLAIIAIAIIWYALASSRGTAGAPSGAVQPAAPPMFATSVLLSA